MNFINKIYKLYNINLQLEELNHIKLLMMKKF